MIEINQKKRFFTVGIILISACAFFFFTLGNIITASQSFHLDKYFTEFISGDFLITTGDSPPLFEYIPEESPLIHEKIFSMDNFIKIVNIIRENTTITAYTPYSLLQTHIINNDKKSVPSVVKVIDSESFFNVFPKITYTDRNTTKGIFFAPSLLDTINSLYDEPVTEGTPLIITGKNGDLLSARVINFSGTVIYKGFSPFLPFTGYCDQKAFLREQPREYVQVSEKGPPDTGTFYNTITASVPPIKKDTLTHDFFSIYLPNPVHRKKTLYNSRHRSGSILPSPVQEIMIQRV